MSLLLEDLDSEDRIMMNQWYGRNWHYSIIPFCILASIGLIEFSKQKNLHLKPFIIKFNKLPTKSLKMLLFCSLIYLSFSNLIISSLFAAD